VPVAPVLPAWAISDDDVVAWCRHCRFWHHHTAGSGHRTARCPPGTGYATSGYVLHVQPAPAWVRDDIGRAKPQGPPVRAPYRRQGGIVSWHAP
jgi:hypothetical protein